MRRDLVLYRHAKAGLGRPGGSDHDRPLTGRGRRAAVAIAAALVARGAPPDLILCSTALRTRETLEPLLARLTPTPPVSLEPGLYLASAQALLARLRQVPGDVERVILIGHNDGMAELARALATSGDPAALGAIAIKYPTGAAACLRATLDDWSDLGHADVYLEAFLRPRDLMTGAPNP
ncbi:MAG: histidine phosphatase family protein [Alphaproteobacteria bacterium]|nr:histidine phosphatase family protein [Alphaproteobacteria bacterium]